MTVIAYDGVSMAVDGCWNDGVIKGECVKWKQISGNRFLFFSGTLVEQRRVFKWFEDGADPDEFPELGENATFTLVVWSPGEQPVEYDDSPYPTHTTDLITAWGCGGSREMVLGAMHAGKSATTAIWLAIGSCLRIDSPIYTVDYEGKVTKHTQEHTLVELPYDCA